MFSKCLAFFACLLLLSSVCRADSPAACTIQIKDFSQDHVSLKFPSSEARTAFWIAFTDACWPRCLRTGKEAANFNRHWGPIIRGEKEYSGLTQSVARGAMYFDGHAPATAKTLKACGIRLEIIESSISPTEKCERVVVAE